MEHDRARFTWLTMLTCIARPSFCACKSSTSHQRSPPVWNLAFGVSLQRCRQMPSDRIQSSGCAHRHGHRHRHGRLHWMFLYSDPRGKRLVLTTRVCCEAPCRVARLSSAVRVLRRTLSGHVRACALSRANLCVYSLCHGGGISLRSI